MPNITGIAKSVFTISEDDCESISSLKLKIGDNDIDSAWTLQGVTIAIKAYSDISSEFESQIL